MLTIAPELVPQMIRAGSIMLAVIASRNLVEPIDSGRPRPRRCSAKLAAAGLQSKWIRYDSLIDLATNMPVDLPGT
jgi:hypothetical protein